MDGMRVRKCSCELHFQDDIAPSTPSGSHFSPFLVLTPPHPLTRLGTRQPPHPPSLIRRHLLLAHRFHRTHLSVQPSISAPSVPELSCPSRKPPTAPCPTTLLSLPSSTRSPTRPSSSTRSPSLCSRPRTTPSSDGVHSHSPSLEDRYPATSRALSARRVSSLTSGASSITYQRFVS